MNPGKKTDGGYPENAPRPLFVEPRPRCWWVELVAALAASGIIAFGFSFMIFVIALLWRGIRWGFNL